MGITAKDEKNLRKSTRRRLPANCAKVREMDGRLRRKRGLQPLRTETASQSLSERTRSAESPGPRRHVRRAAVAAARSAERNKRLTASESPLEIHASDLLNHALFRRNEKAVRLPPPRRAWKARFVFGREAQARSLKTMSRTITLTVSLSRRLASSMTMSRQPTNTEPRWHFIARTAASDASSFIHYGTTPCYNSSGPSIW